MQHGRRRMAKVAVSVDDALLRGAQRRTLEQGTSVNALVRAYLKTHAGGQDVRQSTVEYLLSRSRSRRVKSGSRGRRCTRDEIHDR